METSRAGAEKDPAQALFAVPRDLPHYQNWHCRQKKGMYEKMRAEQSDALVMKAVFML